jgi:hypothetical protein
MDNRQIVAIIEARLFTMYSCIWRASDAKGPVPCAMQKTAYAQRETWAFHWNISTSNLRQVLSHSCLSQ